MNKQSRQFLFAVFVLMSITGFSQQSGIISSDTLAAREAVILRRVLSLNTQQQQKVEVAAKKHHGRLKKMPQNMSSQARKNVLLTVHNEYIGEIKAALTHEQFKNYEAMREKHKKAFKDHAEKKGIKVKHLED